MADQLLVTISQACRIAQVSRRTIYNWIKLGRVTVYRTAGGNVRLNPHELVARPVVGVANEGAWVAR